MKMELDMDSAVITSLKYILEIQ